MPKGRKNQHKRRPPTTRRVVPYKFKGNRATFDPALTTARNYKAMGLVSRPNAPSQLTPFVAGRLLGAAAGGLVVVDLEEAKALASRVLSVAGTGARPAHWMRDDEVAYLRRLEAV
jgi:hypothetical protein